MVLSYFGIFIFFFTKLRNNLACTAEGFKEGKDL